MVFGNKLEHEGGIGFVLFVGYLWDNERRIMSSMTIFISCKDNVIEGNSFS